VNQAQSKLPQIKARASLASLERVQRKPRSSLPRTSTKRSQSKFRDKARARASPEPSQKKATASTEQS
jgi:hypothetical protein